MIKNEIWRDVKNFEHYEVSNLGRVRRKEGTSHLKPRILKHIFDKDGYPKVNLKTNQKTTSRRIHRLISQAFIPNPENKPQVNHINGDKSDFRIDNLRMGNPVGK